MVSESKEEVREEALDMSVARARIPLARIERRSQEGVGQEGVGYQREGQEGSGYQREGQDGAGQEEAGQGRGEGDLASICQSEEAGIQMHSSLLWPV